jgi:hypothetical protein
MNIYFNKKFLKSISNSTELENFLIENNIFSYFKKIPVLYKELVDNTILKTEKLNYKQIKKWYRSVINYPETIYDKNFLICMGWDLEDVEIFIKNKQKTNSKILSEKKKENPSFYYSKCPKRIEYWIEKGLDESQAIKKVSDSQKTFSKEICIKKYGLEKGETIFNQRQKKWVESLKSNLKLNEFRKKQNSYNYKEDSVNNLINRTSFLEETKKIILESITEKNVEFFIKKIIEKIDIKSFSDIIPFINSKIIQNHYQVDSNKIKKIFFNEISDKLKYGYYGKPIYHKGIRFKSIKEYKIALLLESNNINYYYEKNYPNSKFKCDFYLPDSDVYIEYFGILDSKKIENLDEKQLKYWKKMCEKILFCDENKINLVYDSEYKKLISKIKKIL